MSVVELNIDEDKHHFLIYDSALQISKSYRARYYFADVLHASFQENGTIAIDYEDDEKEAVLKRIQDALAKYGIETSDSKKIVETLDAYYREKENFKEFSTKAKGIWNNEVNEKEFRSFKQSVETQLVGRTLYDKQLLAAFHLAFSQNACNFSVPGSGKTAIVYAAFSYLKHLPKEDPKYINKLLVIGPLSSFGPWEDEYFLCYGREPNSIRLSGGMSKEDRDRHLKSIDPVENTPELDLNVISECAVQSVQPPLLSAANRQQSNGCSR